MGAAAAEPPAPAASTPAALQVFVRDGCPYCADARAFLDGVQRQRPGLLIVYRPVDTDPAAREELNALSSADGAWPPGVPAFHAAGQLSVGFESAETTGQELLRLIDAGTAAQKQSVDSAHFGTLSAQRLGLPLFTLALGLLDGFNPCAMWVLLFLLSMLVRQNDRRRMALIWSDAPPRGRGRALEQLCRYITPAALANERLHCNASARACSGALYDAP